MGKMSTLLSKIRLNSFVDPQYLKSVFYVVIASMIYVVQDIRIQSLFRYGINVALFNFIKSMIGMIILLIITNLYSSYTSSNFYIFPRTKAMPAYMIKCFLFVIGASLWSKGVAGPELVPPYIVAFCSFFIPLTLKILSSIFYLSEYKKNKYIIWILSYACSLIFVYVFKNTYRYQILFLVLGNILYAVVDFINQMIVKQSSNKLINYLVGSKSDSILTCLFYNYLCAAIFFGIQCFYQMLSSCSIYEEIVLISSLPRKELMSYVFAIFSSLSGINLMLRAFALKGAAAAEVVKSFDPLIAGLFTNAHVDTIIRFASTIFFVGMIYSVYIDSRPDNCKNK